LTVWEKMKRKDKKKWSKKDKKGKDADTEANWKEKVKDKIRKLWLTEEGVRESLGFQKVEQALYWRKSHGNDGKWSSKVRGKVLERQGALTKAKLT